MPRLVLLSSLFLVASCAAAPHSRSGETTSFDGLSLVFEARGEGAPALVFVHGWCCDRSFWRDQVSVFAADHRIVTLDLGGHGRSGRERARWDLEGLARDVAAVVEELDLERVILVGHSMGGPVCVLAAPLLPDRVLGVVGVDTLHDVTLEWDESLLRSWEEAMEADFPGYMRGFVGEMFPEGSDSALRARVMAVMGAADPEVGQDLMGAMFAFDGEAAFAACPVPVRCINAADGYPTNVEANRRFAPTFDVIGMSDVGHFLMMERPEKFNVHLRTAIREILEPGS